MGISADSKSRVRRSHAERRAETRSRIIHAVVDCIAELGFQRATATEITSRAGVTWGAVQHHFGGKEGMLVAALEESFRIFEARCEDIPIREASLEDRVSMFIDRTWEHFGSAYYRATFEILLNLMRDEDEAAGHAIRGQMIQAWDQLWTRIFFDSTLNRSERLVLENYTISTLSGLAASMILQAREAVEPYAETALLKKTLIRELRGSDG